MKNPIALALALCLLLLAFVLLPTSQSEATITPTIQHDLTVATVAALDTIKPTPAVKFSNFVSTEAPAASPPESSDEPISAGSAGSYAGSGSAGSYGYGSYYTSSSSGAYGSYMSGSSSGSYSNSYAVHHSGPVRGFFRNGGFFRRGIIRGRWQAHGPRGGIFSGGCLHCRS